MIHVGVDLERNIKSATTPINSMISFVYFDLGGVVEKDFSASKKWDDLREELGIEPSEAYEKFWVDVERDICTKDEVDSLLPVLKEKFGAKIPENYSLLHAFFKRFEKNESIWPVIEEIHKTTKIGILSNMYPGMLNAIKESGILPEVSWDVVIDSSVEHIMKPDMAIFQLAEERAHLPGNEILFVENSQKHIDVATQRDWQTFLYDSSNYEKASEDFMQFWQNSNQ